MGNLKNACLKRGFFYDFTNRDNFALNIMELFFSFLERILFIVVMNRKWKIEMGSITIGLENSSRAKNIECSRNFTKMGLF